MILVEDSSGNRYLPRERRSSRTHFRRRHGDAPIGHRADTKKGNEADEEEIQRGCEFKRFTLRAKMESGFQ